MRTVTHFYTSLLLSGSLYVIYQSIEISISCLLSGIFIDLDHIFDFLFFSNYKFSVKKFYCWCDEGKMQKLILIFHSVELYIIIVIINIVYPCNVSVGILFGCGLHLALDEIRNCFSRKKFIISRSFYFLTYRARNKFLTEKMCNLNCE